MTERSESESSGSAHIVAIEFLLTDESLIRKDDSLRTRELLSTGDEDPSSIAITSSDELQWCKSRCEARAETIEGDIGRFDLHRIAVDA